MEFKRNSWCFGAILIAAFAILPWHFLSTPIRRDFIEAYGADIRLIFRPGTITHNFADCILLFGLWLAGWGLGQWLLRILSPRATFLSSWAASLLIGWGILSHGLFFLAAVQRLAFLEISCLLGFGCAIGLWEIGLVLRSEPSVKERCRRLVGQFPRSPEGAIILFVCSALLFCSFLSSLMPPTQSDALRYHLTVPKLWLQHGGFYRIPNISFSNFPMTIDILYAVPLAFDLPSVAKLLHWSLLLASLGMLYRMGAVYGGRVAACLSVALFATIPFVPILASWAFVEMGLCAYLLLTVAACLELVHKRSSWRLVVVLGLAGGWLLGCKYTSLIFLFLLFLMLLLPRRIFAVPRLNRRGVVVAGILALLVAGPWYLKNLTYNANPVYPMGIGVFGELEWTKANAAFFSYHAGLKGHLIAAHDLSLPAQVADTARLIVEPLWSPIDIGANDFGDWPMSALFVILIPALLLRKEKSWPKRFLAVYAGLLFVVWAWTYRDARFLLPALCVLSIPLSIGCVELWSRQRLLRWLVVLVVLYYGLWNLGKFCDVNGFSPWKVVSGFLDEDRYLHINNTTGTFYHGFEAVKEYVPADAKILIHGQHYNFYCPRPFLGADWFDTPPLIVMARAAGNVDDLIDSIQNKGISYILHDKKTIERYNNKVLPAYWLLCLPPDRATEFLQQLRDLEPIRRFDSSEWLQRGETWHDSVDSAVEADPGWQRLESFWKSPRLETIDEKSGMRLVRIQPRSMP
ncbi:MAG: hypothetical protein ABIH23_19110 [bacterium]